MKCIKRLLPGLENFFSQTSTRGELANPDLDYIPDVYSIWLYYGIAAINGKLANENISCGDVMR